MLHCPQSYYGIMYGAQRTHLVHLEASLVNKRLPTSIKATARSNLGFFCVLFTGKLYSFVLLINFINSARLLVKTLRYRLLRLAG